MKKVKKKEGKIVQAYCLGEKHPVIEKLIQSGAIKQVDDTKWRIFSREAKDGELAFNGDYIKQDSSGSPYPNSREFFEKNHKHIEGDNYMQIPKPLNAWSLEEGMCPEIQFLIDYKGLVIDEQNEAAYFKAPLWGDMLSAARDAVIVFYEVEYDENQNILDADFNFVARDEFIKTYE